ncbi:MAG: hypothetical protein HZA54_01190 [Planctomycetes bacterium]|nr:hypothetical protein [Planctomycetota bacterium]
MNARMRPVFRSTGLPGALGWTVAFALASALSLLSPGPRAEEPRRLAPGASSHLLPRPALPSDPLVALARLAPLDHRAESERIGSFIGQFLAPELPPAALADLRSRLGEENRALRAAPDFAALPTMVPGSPAAREHAARWHYFLYVPRSLPPAGAPRRLLLFLHGVGGNFHVYLWWLRELAESTGLLVACPSYGAGMWSASSPGAGDLVLAVRDDVAELAGGRLDRCYLAGLSSGARACALVLAALPQTFAACALISGAPTDDDEIDVLAGVPVGFFVGDADAPALGAVERAERRLRAAGGQGGSPVAHRYPQGDHFLLLRRRSEVLHDIQQFLTAR